MSGVDVLAVLDRQLRNRAERANRYERQAKKALRKSGEPQITADRMAAYEMLLFSELREARAAVAELIEDRRILAEAIRAVESTFQPTEGRIGTGRYSFPANGVAADRLRAALARVGGAS